MNSSIIMFSNMFSENYFYKHCKSQSLLQCTDVAPIRPRLSGRNLFRESGNFSASVPKQRHLASLRHRSPDMDCAPLLFFPGADQAWPRFGGAFFLNPF